MMNDHLLRRVDDQIVANARNREILYQLVSSIVSLRRWRGYFNDNKRLLQDHGIEVSGHAALHGGIRLAGMFVVYDHRHPIGEHSTWQTRPRYGVAECPENSGF